MTNKHFPSAFGKSAPPILPTEGTTTLLDLASELSEVAPHVAEAYDLGRACKLMQRAAEAIERLAPMDPDIEVEHGEN